MEFLILFQNSALFRRNSADLRRTFKLSRHFTLFNFKKLTIKWSFSHRKFPEPNNATVKFFTIGRDSGLNYAMNKYFVTPPWETETYRNLHLTGLLERIQTGKLDQHKRVNITKQDGNSHEKNLRFLQVNEGAFPNAKFMRLLENVSQIFLLLRKFDYFSLKRFQDISKAVNTISIYMTEPSDLPKLHRFEFGLLPKIRNSPFI